MTRTVRLVRRATSELAEAQFFYEEQSPELGDYFRRCILEDLEALATTAAVHSKAHGMHRYLCKRFPHAIFYLVEGRTVRVYAVLDCRRDPRKIRQRLRGL